MLKNIFYALIISVVLGVIFGVVFGLVNRFFFEIHPFVSWSITGMATVFILSKNEKRGEQV